ncbi:10418_t:CDS:2, partial [Scutellospora calospora]
MASSQPSDEFTNINSTRLIDYLANSLKQTAKGVHTYTIYALSTKLTPKDSLTLKDGSNTSGSNLFERQLLLLVNEKIPATKNNEIFVTGVEIYEYHDFDRDSLNIYISKVDTTGYRPYSYTPTKNLLIAYMKFYLEDISVNKKLLLKRKTIKFNIFARPHPQYLFRHSDKNLMKHVLDDSELLKWWKNILQQTFLSENIQEKTRKKRGWFYFPGIPSDNMALTFIRDNVDGEVENSENSFWQYGYPYPDDEEAIKVIPRFEDDAKTRWLDTAGESSLTVKNFWELISIGGEFAGGRQAGFFWVEAVLEDNRDLTNQDMEIESIVDHQSLNSEIKEELEKEVGGIVVSINTYVKALGELFAQEFHSEEAAIESTSYWCRYFYKLYSNNIAIEFMVNNSNNLQARVKRKADYDQQLNATLVTPVNNQQMQRTNDDELPNTILNITTKDIKINVLSPSLIKR